MPIHLDSAPVSRRRFVSSLLAASGVAGGLFGRFASLAAAQEAGADASEAWALFSDTHIAADPDFNARGINMAAHLRQALTEALAAHARKPVQGLLINGDCAYLDGQAEDYATLGKLLVPVVEKGIPIHVTLGNHDERGRIQAGLGSVFGPGAKPLGKGAGAVRADLSDKLASCVRGRFCDWYLLDSLDVTNKTPGRVGEAQLAWLSASLKAAPERPALVMVHHNPQPKFMGKVSGLEDTDALLDLLLPLKQVKALFFGHTHVNLTVAVEGLHLVNLPACAYRFGAEQPTGWTSALVDARGCSLTLFDTEMRHALHQKEVRLEWRS
jgi:3',5'-cyclic AMP phosphodiesterase CpdA